MFDGNAYRKGVLASIEARGGVPASDPFEWYDLPLDEKLKDSAVRSQIDSVWAFWQKQREAPKYRGLILALLARHSDVAPLLWDKRSRQELAEQVRRERAERSADRFAELDAAIGRLVERFGGIPVSKVEGLVAFAAERSIPAADARARIDAQPVVAEAARAGAVDPYRRARADLEELGRLLEEPPCPSLFVLLDLPPTAGRRDIVQARDRVAARNRELLPDRRRALVDDLLAAVTNLLVEGDPETYLSALAVDVTELVRPRFQAAVLVEDLLTADDAAFLITEAEALGLDTARARDVVVALAREAGVPMPATARRPEPATGVPEGYQRKPREQVPASSWHEQLAAARAALRDGRVHDAQRLVEAARAAAGGTTPPIRAVSDEVEAALAEEAAAAVEPVGPPSTVRAALANGGVQLTWDPSPTPGVDYRVTVIEPDGRRRVVGTTAACALEAAAPVGGGPLPSYAVEARRAGVASAEATTAVAAPPEPVELPGVTDLARTGAVLTWTWPAGITEVLLVWRAGMGPESADDPAAQRRKVTNTRYEIDGGAAAPEGPDLHLAVYSCTRVASALVTSPVPGATLRW